jgi:hypothetical protein
MVLVVESVLNAFLDLVLICKPLLYAFMIVMKQESLQIYLCSRLENKGQGHGSDSEDQKGGGEIEVGVNDVRKKNAVAKQAEPEP